MTKDELLKLIDAGFTKEDIIALNSTKEFQVAASSAGSESEGATEAVANESAQANTSTNEENQYNEVFTRLNKAVEDFTKKVEGMNVINAEQNRENKGDESLGDILARVLTPDGKEI